MFHVGYWRRIIVLERILSLSTIRSAYSEDQVTRSFLPLELSDQWFRSNVSISVIHTRLPGPPRPSRKPIVYQTQANLVKHAVRSISSALSEALTSARQARRHRWVREVLLHHILSNYLIFERHDQAGVIGGLSTLRKYCHSAEICQSEKRKRKRGEAKWQLKQFCSKNLLLQPLERHWTHRKVSRRADRSQTSSSSRSFEYV